MTPSQFVALLHPVSARGKITLATGGPCWSEQAYTRGDLIANVDDYSGQPEIYVSYQAFRGHRCLKNLSHLGALYVDLDFHRMEAWTSLPAEWVAEQVRVRLSDENLPTPSYILSSGRGLLAVWLHNCVPKAALPRWQAIQRELGRVLAGFGADRNACDAARVFRLLGSRNSKSGTLVRPIFWAPGTLEGGRWDFEVLAQEILPVHRRELEQRKPSKRPTRTRVHMSGPRLNRRTYWETINEDLDALLQIRWRGNVPSGSRNAFLLHKAICTLLAPFPRRPPPHLPRSCAPRCRLV